MGEEGWRLRFVRPPPAGGELYRRQGHGDLDDTAPPLLRGVRWPYCGYLAVVLFD